MTRSEMVEQLKNEYRRRRMQAEQEQDARVREVERADPQIHALWAKQARLLNDAGRAMVARTPDAQEKAVRMREEGQAVLREIRERTVRAGFPEDYMRMRYRCPKCKDKGMVESGFCECFRRELNERMGSAYRTLDSFETFREDFIPAQPVEGIAGTQRQALCGARDYLLRYCGKYPAVDKRVLVLYGEAGLGKTFLLNCVVRRLAEQGVDVMNVTAYKMLDAMRDKYFGEDGAEFDRMLSCAFLAVDDLGTEPIMRNITGESLFLLLNERVNARLCTIFATNLTPPQLRERYGERIASRLFDRENGAFLRFVGKDLRTQKG